jgi:hypothetical protein
MPTPREKIKLKYGFLIGLMPSSLRASRKLSILLNCQAAMDIVENSIRQFH